MDKMLTFLGIQQNRDELDIESYKFEEEECLEMFNQVTLKPSLSMSSVMSNGVLVYPENSNFIQ